MAIGSRPAKWRVAVAVLLAAVLAAAALLWWDSGDDRPVLRVGDQQGAFRILMEKAGQLDALPYRIEWSDFPAAGVALEAAGADAVDITGAGGAPFVMAFSNGAKIKAIQAHRYIDGYEKAAAAVIVPANSPIRSFADLKGKKVGTIRGSAGHDLMLGLLDKEGMKPSDIEWAFLNNPDSKAALATGAIDAWATWNVYVAYAVLHDKQRVLVNAGALPPMVGLFVAGDKAIAEKRPMLTDFLQRLRRARDWATSHPRAYAEAVAKQKKLPTDIAVFALQSTIGHVGAIDDEVVALQRANFERYRRAGLIKAIPDMAKGYDRSFNAAVASDAPVFLAGGAK